MEESEEESKEERLNHLMNHVLLFLRGGDLRSCFLLMRMISKKAT